MADVISIYKILPDGRENAIPAAAIRELTGLARRELTKMIEAERRAGHPICSTTDYTAPGYFMPANQSELMMFCKSLDGRAESIKKTAEACRRAAEGLPL